MKDYQIEFVLKAMNEENIKRDNLMGRESTTGTEKKEIYLADGTDLQKLDGKIALFTIRSYINSNSDEVCDFINKTMDELEKEGYVKYLFDLRYLKFVNGRFIGLLGKRHYGLKEIGGGIAILNAQDMVNNAFEMCGVSDLLQFFFDRDEAIISFEN